MHSAPELPEAPEAAHPVCCILPLVTLCVDAPVDWTCQALLAYAGRTGEILFVGPAESVILSGRWRAQRMDSMRVVRYELAEGPLPGLTCGMEARALPSGATLLECDGFYLPPAAARAAGDLDVDGALLEWDGIPLALGDPGTPGGRVRQLAEGLRAGLLRSIERVFAPGGDVLGKLRAERRSGQRHPLALPIRLRLGAVPWPGVLRDVSAGGVAVSIPAPARQVFTIAALLAEQAAGELEVLFDDGRLSAEVRITRAEADVTAVSVGLEVGAGEAGTRLRGRLAALGR